MPPHMSPELSIVIPVLDEASGIEAALDALAAARTRGAEIIVVDGGSSDDTVALARRRADRVICGARGRATQMNAGAEAAAGRILHFLHADSRPPDGFDRTLIERIGNKEMAWGRFDVRIDGRHPGLAVVGDMMNIRSRMTGIATGDQGIFATRSLFRAVGGFPNQPLMEDVEFSRRAKRLASPLCLRDRMHTSGRRWERNGLVATVLLMWRLRLSYHLGADPEDLRKRYVDAR